MNLDRIQRYLSTLSRLPTDDEVADMVQMSRRGFFGATAGLLAAPYFAPEISYRFVTVSRILDDTQYHYSWIPTRNPADARVAAYRLGYQSGLTVNTITTREFHR